MNALNIFLFPFSWYMYILILSSDVVRVTSQQCTITLDPPSIVCNEGVCFLQVLNDVHDISLGLALPPLQPNQPAGTSPDELLVNLTMPTQNGYAAFTVGSSISSNPLAAGYCRFGTPPGASPSLSNYILESVTLSPNMLLVPTTQSTFTLSDSLSLAGPNTVSAIFRCQSCFGNAGSIASAQGVIDMTAISSTLRPEYVDITLNTADLPIGGLGGFPFTFVVNITAARFAEYNSFLQTAGLM